MKFDDILCEIGEFGPYQKRVYCLLCLPNINCGILMVISVFILATPDHRCAIPGLTNDTYEIQSEFHRKQVNASIPYIAKDEAYSQCDIYRADNSTEYDEFGVPVNAKTGSCDKWVYSKTPFESTAAAEMNLVCSGAIKTSHAQMIFMGGVLVGSIAFGNLADIMGRKKTLCVAILLNLATGLGLAWAPEFISFVILRFLSGASSSGIYMSSFVLGMELVGPSKRTWAGMVIAYFFALGLVVLAGLAYLIRDWHTLQLVCSAPVAMYLLYWWVVPESARWLLSQGREDEAEAILRHAAAVNGRSLPQKLFDEQTIEEAEQGRIWHLFQHPVLIIRTLIIYFNWMTVGMAYYGLSLNTGNLGGDLYVNFLLSGAVEFPAYTICIILLDRLGRKKLHVLSMILGGVACLSTLFTVLFAKHLEALTITLAMIGKLGAAAAFAVIYVFAAELFPTVVRNGAMGLSSIFSPVGGMIAPYITKAGDAIGGNYGTALPLVIFGSLSIAAGLTALLLPETLNKRLPETIPEAINFGRNRRYTLRKWLENFPFYFFLL